MFLDAAYLDVRQRGRVVSEPLVVTTGVSGDGRREILGMALGDAEAGVLEVFDRPGASPPDPGRG